MSVWLMNGLLNGSAIASENAPDLALLEMLGQVGDLEELGVEVDRLIEERLDTGQTDDDQEQTE